MAEPGEEQRTHVADEPAPPVTPDYYALLGVAPTANEDEIRHAYHAAAKQWHPDRFMAASEDEREHAERQMRALIEAHDVLSDPARRALYDARRRAAHAAGHERDVGEEDAEPADSTDWAAGDHESYDRIYANSDPRGVASFLGVLLGLVAMGFLRGSFAAAPGLGSYAALIVAVVCGFGALWCFADPSGLAHAADRLAPHTPPRAQHVHGQHAAHHAHSQHAAHPKHHPAHEPTAEERAAQEHDAEFERQVREAMAGIPEEFQPYLRNVVVRVRQHPTAEERRLMHLREGETLFGLYHGVALTDQGAAGAGPEVITIYQRPIERFCAGDPERIRDQVRRTVLHELAHHFGIDHEEMPEWIR